MQKDDFPLLGIDHIRLHVASPAQTVRFWRDVLGFTKIAYAGPETGHPDTVSHVLAQGDMRVVITGSRDPDSYISKQVEYHGDTVADIALGVPDARTAYATAVRRGAIDFMGPRECRDKFGKVIMAGIRTYGDTLHSLVERSDYHGVFLPGFESENRSIGPGVGLCAFDHVVGNVERGYMNRWSQYYEDVAGFTNTIHFTDKDIKTKETALMSKVMQNRTGKIKFPINEPASKKESHVDEYLRCHGGPGVQHIAMETKDIVATVRTLRDRGVQFSPIPSTYYRKVRERFADFERAIIDTWQELDILADRDEDGYLLQIFTKPIVDRPTLFLEFIERQGSQGFGHGNFQALYEAKELEKLEREEAERGML